MVEKQEAQDNVIIDNKNDICSSESKDAIESEGISSPKKKKFKADLEDPDTSNKSEENIPDLDLKLQKNSSDIKITDSKLTVEKIGKETATPKREKSDAYDDEIPAPEGWKRLSVQRMGGVSAGKLDIYYISPLGKRLRSRKEVMTYCEKMGIEVNMEDFIFNAAGRTPGRTKKAPESPSKSISTPKTTPKTTPASKNIQTPKNLATLKTKVAQSAAASVKKSPSKKENISKSPKKIDEVKKSPKKRISSFKVLSDGLFRAKLKPHTVWVPPKSPFNLFQESLYDKPWQLLAGTIILGRTSGADNFGSELLYGFLKRFPTPEVSVKADPSDIAESLSSLPHNDRIAKMIIKFSEEFLKNQWTYPKELHGIGKFGNDSYRVFCINEWKKVKPSDFLLNFYVDWLWDNHVILEIN